MRDTLRLKLPYMRGKDVIYCQERLIVWGCDIGVDGLFGRKTMNAVKSLQKTAGLKVDGIVGKLTWAVLDDSPIEKEYITLLRKWGFSNILMNLGEKYTIKQYQSAMGLKVDGIVGDETMCALRSEVIKPRFAEPILVCQCRAAGKNFCDGYPKGIGAGVGVLLLAERIMREVDKTYPGTVYAVSSVATPATNGAVAGGYRCERWNKERGGSRSSRHLAGCALDLYGKCLGISDAKIRDEIERVALKLNVYGGVGHSARYIVHIDTRGKKARWNYGN